MTKTETTTQSIPEYFYDDLRPKGAIGNQCSTNLSAKEYDLSYSYDGDGLRVSRTDNVSGLTTYYVWDTENPTGYPQVIEEIENNQVVRRYGYGLFLENVDIWNGTSFDRFYVVRDGTNSVRMLLDSAGNVAAEYDYDAFGNVLRSTINTPLSTQNSYGFHSEYRDTATGLVYLRARWYEPKTGRFVGMDRWEGNVNDPQTLNKYASFNNDPTNRIDPSGNFNIYIAMGTIAMIGILADNAFAHLPTQGIGEAWPHLAEKWTQADVVGYRDWISSRYSSYLGTSADCADLAVTMLVHYAVSKGLPVHLVSRKQSSNNPTPHYSNRTTFRNPEIFLNYAKEWISAEVIWNLNSFSKASVRDIPSKAETGDLMMLLRNGDNSTGHTMVFLNYSNNQIKWIQGNDPPVISVNEESFSDFITGKKPESLRFWNQNVFSR